VQITAICIAPNTESPQFVLSTAETEKEEKAKYKLSVASSMLRGRRHRLRPPKVSRNRDAAATAAERKTARQIGLVCRLSRLNLIMASSPVRQKTVSVVRHLSLHALFRLSFEVRLHFLRQFPR